MQILPSDTQITAIVVHLPSAPAKREWQITVYAIARARQRAKHRKLLFCRLPSRRRDVRLYSRPTQRAQLAVWGIVAPRLTRVKTTARYRTCTRAIAQMAKTITICVRQSVGKRWRISQQLHLEQQEQEQFPSSFKSAQLRAHVKGRIHPAQLLLIWHVHSPAPPPAAAVWQLWSHSAPILPTLMAT